MSTPQWVKKLGGHAGELYVAAELSKRGIPNALLPENFSDDDLIAGRKNGSEICFIQVKSCHPDRSKSFILDREDEKWIDAEENQFVVFVWLGSPRKNESPRYWVATKRQVGQACLAHPAHGTDNWERRFFLCQNKESLNLKREWEDNWKLFDRFVDVPDKAKERANKVKERAKARLKRLAEKAAKLEAQIVEAGERTDLESSE